MLIYINNMIGNRILMKILADYFEFCDMI